MWELVVAIVGGLVSGAAGGWFAGRSASRHEVHQSLTAERDASPSSSSTTGDHSPAFAASGQNVNQAGRDVHVTAAAKAELVVEIEDAPWVTVRNAGTGRARQVMFRSVGSAGDRYVDMSPDGPLYDLQPGQGARVGYRSRSIIAPPVPTRTFDVSWVNPDGTPDNYSVVYD